MTEDFNDYTTRISTVVDEKGNNLFSRYSNLLVWVFFVFVVVFLGFSEIMSVLDIPTWVKVVIGAAFGLSLGNALKFICNKILKDLTRKAIDQQ